MIAVELRGLDPVMLRALLVEELGGAQRPDTAVHGDGGCVRFPRLPDVQVGAIWVRAHRVEIDGPHAERVAAFVRRRFTRGGG
jgi:hypothetical protein